MNLKNSKAFVTGGAGFIGSHLVDALMELGCSVTVYDNFSTGQELFIKQHLGKESFKLVKGDILDLENLSKHVKGNDIVFHFAANADVRGGVKNTRVDLDQNVIGTWSVLEAMRLTDVKNIAFTSTSSIYGEPDVFPTPEDYSPCIQISMYGASKYAAEAYIQAFCEAFDFKSWIFRFVSMIGERYTHGAIFDFTKKLLNNPKELEILGNGKQKKSYLYVKECIKAILLSVEKTKECVNILNLGHSEYVDVTTLASIVVDEVGLKDVAFKYTGGERGWIGDAPFVHMGIDRIKALGWTPNLSIEEGIRRTVQYLLTNKELLNRK